jgi:hypothetical protein
MKQYKKLRIPTSSSWDKRTWRYYTPRWFNSFVDSICNCIDWLPTIWKDRHWDDEYITKILQRKIELQRNYIVKHNRHTRVDEDNFWMTLVLNLIEREHESYYSTEKYDYEKTDIKFIESIDYPGKYEMKTTVECENLDDYLAKYPAAVRRVKKLYNDKGIEDKSKLSFYVSCYNQERNRNLLFEIMKRYSNRWWD